MRPGYFLLSALSLLFPLISSAQLRSGEASVEFRLEGGKYTASVQKSGWKSPKVVTLCQSKELDDLSEDPYLYEGDAARKMYGLVIGPLESLLGRKCTVFFRPTGRIHFVNLSALIDSEGNRSMDRYRFIRVSDLSSLPREKKGKYYDGDLLVYGGMDYMASPSEIGQNGWWAHTYYSRSRYADAGGWGRLNLSFGTSEDGTRAGFRNLEGSRSELRFIYDMKNISTTVNTGSKAIEEKFRQDATRTGKYIIHVSTHSFTDNPPEGSRFSGLSEEDMALKSCGLLFSGAGHTIKGEKMTYTMEVGGEPTTYILNDGLLYGEEIASLRMGSCDMVVLAACGTALGRVTQDGVLGLQSAFKKAGAGTILMTLWSVNDVATATFMKIFYSHLLDGETKHDSLEMTRKEMIASEDYSDPYYWAPFIMLD